jgi:iron-only hydrogenase group A
MTAALRHMGFEGVFDTSFSADLTIMEEASELVHRIQTGGPLPLLTSCSPGWVKFIEQFYPDMLPHVSSCKSPQQMLGAVIKSYYAERQGIAPESIYSVSIMPCTAKKFEAQRPEMLTDGIADVDAVLTTRELAKMIRQFGVDMNAFAPEPADSPFGERSTAGKLFGATGGVMEAALRTAHYMLTGEDMEDPKVAGLRGLKGHKEAHLEIAGLTVGVAVVSGLMNAREVLDSLRAGRDDLHFIEIMACPGGCIAGGGQPLGTDMDAVRKRMEALYRIDRDGRTRFSHRNAEVRRLYDEFLGEPLGEKSHHLLHTHYAARETVT